MDHQASDYGRKLSSSVNNMAKFLAINCPSAFNSVIGRKLLKALKAVTSIHCLIIKFPQWQESGKCEGNSGTQGSATTGHSS